MIENNSYVCENCRKEAKVISFSKDGFPWYHCISCDNCLDPKLKRIYINNGDKKEIAFIQ